MLKGKYEISVWEDIWDPIDKKFIESRLGIIGASTMLTQAKVFEPTLTRNVNGSKKFSFKLYKKYIDNITGEEVFNPFYNWLINERKVKLHHKNKWYDFIIKDIQEDSSNYVCTY